MAQSLLDSIRKDYDEVRARLAVARREAAIVNAQVTRLTVDEAVLLHAIRTLEK